MKLKTLTVDSWKNLSDFRVNFGPGLLNVLVGHNGTGKSNLLEALTIIFRDLDLGVDPTFRYILEYERHGREIRIDADPNRRSGRTKVTVDKSNLPRAEIPSILPTNIFGYYSGPSGRMAAHFTAHHDKYSAQLRSSRSVPLRRLFYARPQHSWFVLLSFFLENDDVVSDFLKDELRIADFDSATFIMRQPAWFDRAKARDDRFWGAEGVVRQFLDTLWDVSLAPMRFESRRATDAKVYFHLPDRRALQRLHEAYGEPGALFKALESTFMDGLLEDVRIHVTTPDSGARLTYRELSEGEQQLLTVLGLLRFTREDESLLLLDEPDTHLNPAWSIKYRKFLETIGGARAGSHIVMATHDAAVIAGLEKENVRLFSRNRQGYVQVRMPDHDPRGTGIGGLMTSDIYGLESQLDPETLHLINRKYELVAKDSLTDDDRAELRRLNAVLEELGFQTSFRDPVYELFARQWAVIRDEYGFNVSVLTPQELEEQNQAAMALLRRILAERPDLLPVVGR
ncbi:AAA family ATPase [Micromonospora chalcea]|uniref:AAA family ATPase n=1 Tax=Micromonospora chalcea TaxID=1874 RepID=UPI00157E174E|nr:AAA family ATPase [Micromonospora chalcea]